MTTQTSKVAIVNGASRGSRAVIAKQLAHQDERAFDLDLVDV